MHSHTWKRYAACILLTYGLFGAAVAKGGPQGGPADFPTEEVAGKKSMSMYSSLIRYYSLSDFGKALDYCDEAIKEGYRLEDYDHVLIFYHFKRDLLKNRNMHFEALVFLRNALQSANDTRNNRFIAKMNLLSGEYFMEINQPDSAVTYFYRARDHAERTGNPNLIIDANMATGDIQAKLGNVEQAIAYYNRALLVIRQVRDRKGNPATDESIIYRNIGNCYLTMRDFERSQASLRKALELSARTGDSYSRSLILGTFGELFMAQNRNYQAVEKFKEAGKEMESLYMRSPLRKYSQKLVYYYNMTGLCYFSMGENTKALEFTGKAMRLARQINDLESLRETYLYQTRIFADQLDYEQAYVLWKVCDSISDSIRRQGTQVDLSKLKLQSEFFEKECENKSLKEENEAKQDLIRQGKRYLILMGAALLVIIALSTVGMWLFREKRKGLILLKQQNERILEQNQVIVSQKLDLEKAFSSLEREHSAGQFELVINQLNPHFLFNSINVIIYLIRKDPEQAILALTDLSKILKYLLQYKEFQLVSLSEELEMIHSYLNIQNLRYAESLKVLMNITPEKLSCMVPLFSLQLLVENAIKHNVVTSDHPLKIEIKNDGDWLIVSNELNPKVSASPSTRIGQKLLVERYAHFTGEVPEFHKVENRYVAKIYLIPYSDDRHSHN